MKHEIYSSLSDLAVEINRLGEESERAGEISKSLSALIKDVGALKLYVPSGFGGYALPFEFHHEVPSLLSTIYGSLGWAYCVSMSHAGILQRFPMVEQQRIWESSSNEWICGAVASPPGKVGIVRRTSHGLKLSGNWKWVTCSGFANWALLRAYFEEDVERKEPLRVLVSQSQWNVIWRWDAYGLRGSGSHSIEVRDASILASEVASEKELGLRSPGKTNMGPWGQAPYQIFFGGSLLGAVLGATRGFLLSYLERFEGAIDAESEIRLGLAWANLDVASDIVTSTVKELGDVAKGTKTLTQADNVRLQNKIAYVVQLCLGSISPFASTIGSSALSRTSTTLRYYFDVLAMAQHASFRSDSAFSRYFSHKLEMLQDDPYRA